MKQRYRIFRAADNEWTAGALGAPSADSVIEAAYGGLSPTAGWGRSLPLAVEEARRWSQSSLRWVDRAISSEVHDIDYEVNAHHAGYREKR